MEEICKCACLILIFKISLFPFVIFSFIFPPHPLFLPFLYVHKSTHHHSFHSTRSEIRWWQPLVLPLGLHPGLYATHQHPVVQHPQLPGDRALPVGNGGHDHAQDAAQGHCALQPGKQVGVPGGVGGRLYSGWSLGTWVDGGWKRMSCTRISCTTTK